MRMRAAVLEEFGEPLAVQEVELAEPRAGEGFDAVLRAGDSDDGRPKMQAELSFAATKPGT
jgi:hypothetical protein